MKLILLLTSLSCFYEVNSTFGFAGFNLFKKDIDIFNQKKIGDFKRNQESDEFRKGNSRRSQDSSRSSRKKDRNIKGGGLFSLINPLPIFKLKPQENTQRPPLINVDPKPPIVTNDPPKTNPQPPVIIVGPKSPIVINDPPKTNPQPPVIIVGPKSPIVINDPPKTNPQPPIVINDPPKTNPQPPIVINDPPKTNPQPPVTNLPPEKPPIIAPAPPVIDEQAIFLSDLLELKDVKISIDGSGNNKVNTKWNAVQTSNKRLIGTSYTDGKSKPVNDRPNPRQISNQVGASSNQFAVDQDGFSMLMTIWGQFIDHDLTLSFKSTDLSEDMSIPIPKGDVIFDPKKTGVEKISFARGLFNLQNNVRMPINSVTGWCDGSQIYGSTKDQADSLRTFQEGKMKTSSGNLLPKDSDGSFFAGDLRVSQNLGLFAIQTLFHREHNLVCDQILSINKKLTDQQIYNIARNLVVAIVNKITYEDYLPKLIGPQLWNKYINVYPGYNQKIDSRIPVEFTSCGFRYGHSTVNNKFPQIEQNGSIKETLELKNIFGREDLVSDERIDLMLRGLAKTGAKQKSCKIIDDLRNFLFFGTGDLYSLNIQRGRDYGLLDYNSMRLALGLKAIPNFQAITNDAASVNSLSKVYQNLQKLDSWVGIICEKKLLKAELGELAAEIVGRTFRDLRNGDRFWYQNVMKPSVVKRVKGFTLSDIIQRNTRIVKIQEDVFLTK